jgi:uncharacterized protein (TIGR00645 family)
MEKGMKNKNNIVETCIEHGLFASRWLMAPFYVGLALALAGLTYSFMLELWIFFSHLADTDPTEVTLGVLSLIDLSLAGNLMLIVIFSGYENFVSKFDLGDNVDQPDWRGTVDFSTLKLKLISSIVAISGIHLLKIFMSPKMIDTESLKWLVITHITFVLSGVMLAIMDFISTKTNLKKIK